MILAIDIGNSRVKAAVFDNDDLIDFISEEKLASRKLLNFIAQHSVKSCIISSVNDRHASIVKLLQHSVPVLTVDLKTKLPVINKYRQPETLGTDRLAAVTGASSIYAHENVLVINAGTCITYDFISSEKKYLGGSISPGLDMRLKALHTFTKRLPLLEKKWVDGLTGHNTSTSMLTGCMQAAVFEARGFIDCYEEKYPPLRVLLTGGDASYFESHLKREIFAVPNLVLIGLNQILKYNALQKT